MWNEGWERRACTCKRICRREPETTAFPNWPFKSQIQEIWLVLKFGWRHKVHLAFSWRFYMGKITCTKMTYHFFLNSFLVRKKFWLAKFGNNTSADKSAGRKPVSRLNRVDTWHVRGITGATVPVGSQMGWFETGFQIGAFLGARVWTRLGALLGTRLGLPSRVPCQAPVSGPVPCRVPSRASVSGPVSAPSYGNVNTAK
jgi:hypothetical protein